MRVVQLSDIHLTDRGTPGTIGIDPASRLAAAVEAVNALAPAPLCVIITGDLVSDPAPERYAYLRELLAELSVPFYLMVGNHDCRDLIREYFPDHSYLQGEDEFLHYVLDLGDRRIVAADTLDPGSHTGRMCARRMRWLNRVLSSDPATPTVVAMHHPPFLTGIAGIDKYALEDGEAVYALLSTYPGVERIISGHVHRPVECTSVGLTATICPAVGVQFGLDFDPAHTSISFFDGPRAFQIHTWAPGGGIVTHTLYF